MNDQTQKKRPPRLAVRLIRMMVKSDDVDFALGDLTETYHHMTSEKGCLLAGLWFWAEAFRSIPRFVRVTLFWRMIMFSNYFKVTLRNLKKHTSYSLINIVGLALGMACTILILLWVQHELSFDRFHEKGDRLFRVADQERYSNGDVLYFKSNPPLLGPTLKESYPEIVNSARIRRIRGSIISHGDLVFNEDDMAGADASLFEMFTFPMIQGDAAEALSDPRGILLSRSMAAKYFGTEDPVGQPLKVDNTLDFHVNGVFEDVPANSHFHFNFIIPFETLEEFGFPMDTWGYFAIQTYIEVAENSDMGALNGKVRNLIQQYDDEAFVTLSLQPIRDIHLFCREYNETGDIRTVILFAAIAGFVLLTACINFMNLSTARSGKRALEIGLRKVVGADRKEIIAQFYGDTLILTFFSMMAALILVHLSLPWFNLLSGKTLSLNILENTPLALILLGTLAVTSLVAGSYPALYLSSFAPVKVLRGSLKSGASSTAFRRILVTLQFVLTITLIIGTLVLNRQMHFMRHFNLGYSQDQVLCLGLKGDTEANRALLKTEFAQITGVTSVTAVSDLPTRLRHSRVLEEWEGRDSDDHFLINMLSADFGLMETLKMKMAQGRYFSPDIPADTSDGLIVNETAVRLMKMDDPLGKRLMGNGRIIGVIRDFHYASLHSAVEPLLIYCGNDGYRFIMLKISAGQSSRVKDDVQRIWKTINPGMPMEYEFLDEQFDRLYRADIRVGKIVNAFSFLTLLIACLGLFGLASFTAEQRTKEIGIRRVLGASLGSVTGLLAREFTKWVLLANLIAWPAGFIVMRKMLAPYAYKVNLSLWIFMAAGGGALIIALATVSFQAVKAARTNPVDALKYE